MRERKREVNLVGPQVRSCRLKRGWTQPEMVAKCQLRGWDISRETLAKIESRLRGVSDVEVVHLARVLGVHFSLLYPEDGDA